MDGIGGGSLLRRRAGGRNGVLKSTADRLDGVGRLFAAAVLAGVFVVAGWAAGYTARAAGPARGPTAVVPSRSCTQACRAAYEAIAEALPHDRDNYLAAAIVGTSGFDYLQLARALHVPTIARIHAEWRRYCQTRYAGDPRASALCIGMIDSSRPTRFPAAPAWATS